MCRGLAPRAFVCAVTVLGLGPLAARGVEDPPQDPVKPQLKVLTELDIAEHTIDGERFGTWGRSGIDELKRILGTEKRQRDVVVQVVLHKKGEPDAVVAGRPALAKGEAEKLLSALKLDRAPHAKVIDFAFRIEMKINGGHPARDLPLSPPLDTPDEARLARFLKAGTAGRLTLLKQWAAEEALPALAATAGDAEARFEGVRNLGQTVAALDATKPLDVAKVTDRNPDYWRALAEMTPGQPLVPATKIALHIAAGEFDKARRLDEVTSFFDNRQSGPSHILGELRTMLNLFYKDVDDAIRLGVAAHDQQRFEEALKTYDRVLKDFPGSAWAQYERFQTRRMMALAKAKGQALPDSDWPKAAQMIYGSDPLYAFGAEARSGTDAYRLFRRMTLNELFKDQAKLREDLVRY
ncbi:MAG: hypothetical protein P4L84_37155, partial [Isosphaeraceae bacterium]|nr:hypothetical protein [Isosphaeraceae bacterium]